MSTNCRECELIRVKGQSDSVVNEAHLLDAGFSGPSLRMTLRYMKTELSREPLHIVDWVCNARHALRHRFATSRTLGRDRNAVLVISQL